MEKKEAMKILKDFHDKSALFSVRTALHTIIPELKESEGEKIREKLIDTFNFYDPAMNSPFLLGIHRKDIIAWLEKQGEQKPVNKDEPKFKVGDTMRTLQEANFGYTDGMPVVVSIDNEYYHCTNELIPIKDQDDYEFPPINLKHKPTDKVVPKFQNGQWIVWQNKCYKVNYNGCGYELIDQNGLSTSLEYGTVDKSAHLWTIRDAKDGDVLSINWDVSDDSWEKIIIFKKYHNKGVKGLLNTPCAEGYGNTFKNGELAFNEEVPYYSKTWTCNLQPATKEQRELLFQKMKEARYEWDAEKKELKKIEQKSYGQRKECLDCQFNYVGECKGSCAMKRSEQKPQRMISAEAKEALYDKPAWSEEDERERKRVEGWLSTFK